MTKDLTKQATCNTCGGTGFDLENSYLSCVCQSQPAQAAAVQPKAQDEREAFEAWADRNWLEPIRPDGFSYYPDTRTQYAWSAWQARAALSSTVSDKDAQDAARYRAFVGLLIAESNNLPMSALQSAIFDGLKSRTDEMTFESFSAVIDEAMRQQAGEKV